MTDQIEQPPAGRTRASYADAFKRHLVSECLVEGASVAGVARRHGINANVLFGWRKDARYNRALSAHPTFLPVALPAPIAPEPPPVSEIDITLRCGSRLICRGNVDEPSLVKVLRAVRRTT